MRSGVERQRHDGQALDGTGGSVSFLHGRWSVLSLTREQRSREVSILSGDQSPDSTWIQHKPVSY